MKLLNIFKKRLITTVSGVKGYYREPLRCSSFRYVIYQKGLSLSGFSAGDKSVVFDSLLYIDIPVRLVSYDFVQRKTREIFIHLKVCPAFEEAHGAQRYVILNSDELDRGLKGLRAFTAHDSHSFSFSLDHYYKVDGMIEEYKSKFLELQELKHENSK